MARKNARKAGRNGPRKLRVDTAGEICYNICSKTRRSGCACGRNQERAMRNNELRGPTAIDTDIIPSDSEHVFTEEALYQEVMMR